MFERNHLKISSTKPCSESLTTYTLLKPNRLHTPGGGGGGQETRLNIHLEVLTTVLKRARDHGITFNREKCQFGMEQIEFFGHVFNKDGLKPSPDKVRAVKDCGVPENKESSWEWTTLSRIMQP